MTFMTSQGSFGLLCKTTRYYYATDKKNSNVLFSENVSKLAKMISGTNFLFCF